MLWATAQERDYNSAHWMTFKQAVDLGGMVKKGEKCARSVFYGTFEKDTDQAEGNSEGEGKTRIPYAKTNTVFNADQIENLPTEYYITPEAPRDLGTEANVELDAFFADTGADIISSDEACRPSRLDGGSCPKLQPKRPRQPPETPFCRWLVAQNGKSREIMNSTSKYQIYGLGRRVSTQSG